MVLVRPHSSRAQERRWTADALREALSADYRVCRLSTADQGQGVRVGIIDSGLCFGSLQNLPVHPTGDAEPTPGHGTRVALTILALASQAHVHLFSLKDGVAGAVSRAAAFEADFLVCAWGAPSSPALEAAFAEVRCPVLTTWIAGQTARAPACLSGVAIVAPWSGWPSGPICFSPSAQSLAGASAATAIAAGIAALLIGVGQPVAETLAFVTNPPYPLQETA